MKLLIFLFSILFSTATYSTVFKVEEKKNSKIIYYDYNKDKKVDLIEHYKNRILVKKEQDLNFDGVMDVVTEFFYHDDDFLPFQIITKKDRIVKKYRNKKLKKVINVTEIDSNGDGKFEKKITDEYPLSQNSDSCEHGISEVSSKVDTLSGLIKDVVGNINNGYLTGEYGHQIHQSCFEKIKSEDFSKIVTSSISEGLSCLEQLAQINTKENPLAENGALVNFVNLKRLFKETPVTITCEESDYDWTRAVGHASTDSSDEIKSLNVKHPYISLPPGGVKTVVETTEEKVDFKRTIFHEQLHNLGFRHAESVEYPYACEECCFPGKKKNVTDAACKICRGQYDTSKGIDKKYLVDSVEWGEESYDSDKAEKSILSYLKENKKNSWGIALFARGNAGIFSALGSEIANIIKEKNKGLSAEEEAFLSKALEYKDEDQIKKAAPHAKVVADVYYKFYYSDDPENALKTLEAQKGVLKKMKADFKGAHLTDEQKYTNEKLYEDAQRVLSDIWLRTYPEPDPLGDKVYEIMKEVGYI